MSGIETGREFAVKKRVDAQTSPGVFWLWFLAKEERFSYRDKRNEIESGESPFPN